MIDFQIQPRRSGKTRYIIEQYKKTGGAVVLHNFIELLYLSRTNGINKNDCYQAQRSTLYQIISGYKIVYFDEFSLQDSIKYDDLILLDSRGIDVIVRTSKGQNIPDYFMNYMKENYPEYCI